jgi:hypothetical protein
MLVLLMPLAKDSMMEIRNAFSSDVVADPPPTSPQGVPVASD